MKWQMQLLATIVDETETYSMNQFKKWNLAFQLDAKLKASL